MKWIGQHIYDLISRFRSDVYLEDVSTGTIASGAHLGLDSNNKIVKAADGGGDLTSIVAGTGLSGTSLTGPIPTLNVDASQPTITTLAGLDAIGTQSEDLDISSYTLVNIDRTALHGNTGAETISALHIDLDRTVPTSGTYIHRDLGIDLDVTSASLGTSSLRGMDIDVIGTTSGTSTATGIELNVSGADTNIGMQILCEGEQLRLSHNLDDYATFTVADTGDLTIETVGNGSVDSDLILKADGRVIIQPADGKTVNIKSTQTSSSTAGAKLNLLSDDGAALGDDHLLGRLAFGAAEDSSGTIRTGAKIEAYADAAWSASENGTRLEFKTMDANNTSELSLTLDSDLLATFAGAVTVTGALTGDLTGDVIGDVTGNLTGQADTVASIAGLAPNTATTQASQPNITGVGTIGTGVWNATAIASAKMATASASAQGAVELATTAEAITGTDTGRAVTPAGLKARVSQIVNLKGYAVLQNDVFDYANAYNTDDEAPFQLDVSYGSGTINSSTEVAQSKLFRAGGFHVPFACTVSDIQAQLTCNNDGNVSIALVEYRPSDAGGDANDHPRTVYETVVVDSENNNNKVSSTTIATGDLDNTAIPAGSHLMIMVKGDGTSVGGTAVFSVAIGLSW